MITPVLESIRIILIPVGIEHIKQYYVDWMNDSQVNKYLESGGDYTIEKLTQFIQTIQKTETLFWAIHIKSNNKHIGNIKIDPINYKHRYAEYGIMMGDKTEWGKGYAKEASELVIDYCFKNPLNLRKINLGVQSKNLSALELYKKLGFIQEGIFRKHVITKEGYDDIIRMSLFNMNHE